MTSRAGLAGRSSAWSPSAEVATPDLTAISFDDRGLVPAVVQDAESAEVLMVAWMNEESLRRTLAERTTWFFSRSRGELWNKGATSGNIQHVQEVLFDCDGDTLLVKVHSEGPACHTGERSCFFRSIDTVP